VEALEKHFVLTKHNPCRLNFNGNHLSRDLQTR
jgi:hypothetical protein